MRSAPERANGWGQEPQVVRITFVIPEANMSGGVRVVAAYAQRLKARGHDVVVVSIPPYEPTARERARALIREFRWLPSPCRGSHLDRVDVPHIVLDRRRPITDGDVPDADVIVATWWETAEWVAALSERKGAKAYLIQHDETVFYPHDDVVSRGRVVETLRLPFRKIAVCSWIAQVYAARGVHDITVVPNGVDHARFVFVERGKRAVPTVGFIYAYPGFKGIDIAVEGIARAREHVPELRVVVFGSERPTTRELPPGAKFVLSPDQAEIPSLYASTDAWIVPSRAEGFGLPVIEAMSTGTPVIATPTGVACDALGDGGGVLLGRTDPRELAGAIRTIARLSETQWRSMSRRARTIAERFDWDGSTMRLEAELLAACGRQPTEALTA